VTCLQPRRRAAASAADAGAPAPDDGQPRASLIAAEGIVTTEAKAKALRPIAEKVITKAKKGGLHNHRQVVSYLNDKEIAAKLFDEIGSALRGPPGGYTRILKLGPRQGDNAPMARIELV
jgi:large subunit ribosomal protein L17